MLFVTRKKHYELAQHKGYDDNMAHGFVTLNIKHHPVVRMKSNLPEKSDSVTSEAFFTIDTPPAREPMLDKPKNAGVEHVASAAK